VRRHAKASFAGSTQGSGMRRGRLGLICLCVLGLAAFLGSSAPSAGAEACPNEEFRQGPSANLSGCRAYELVSPAEMEGQEVAPNKENVEPAPTASPDGEAVAWSALGGFGEASSNGAKNLYLSRRGANWSSQSLSPPLNPVPVAPTALSAGLSEDVEKWVFEGALEPPLTPGASEFAPNFYMRDNTNGSFILLSPGVPPGTFEFEAFSNGPVGMSADGGHVIFLSKYSLTGDCGAPAKVEYLCDANTVTGTVSLVGRAPVTNEVLTSSVVKLAARNFRHPLSVDGSRIFFNGGGEGCGICVRIDGATTQLVSETGAFQIADTEGKVAYVTEGEELKRYDVAADELSASIAGEVQGVLGASDDGSRVYLVSKEELAPGATGGENNLYLWTQGAGFEFIAPGNTSGAFTSNWSTGGTGPSSRITPDGMHLAFQADNSLTGFPGAQAYIYSAATGELVCASCVGPPHSAVIVGGTQNAQIARLSRNLSDDGSRLFFLTTGALVPRDTNGLQDTYVYEAASGEVELISPGNDNCGINCVFVGNDYFGDASASGRDAFFWTRTPLVPVDQGDDLDVYDARVGGGLASQHPASAPPCTGDACRGASSTPSLTGAASAGFVGKGNVSQKQNCNKLGREAKKLSKRAKKLRKNAKQAQRNGKAGVAKKRNKKANRLAKQARNKGKSAKKCRKRNRRASK